VSEPIEAVALEGQTVRVAARLPLPVEPRTLAMAAAIRLFERYPVFDRLTLTVGSTETRVSRETIRRVLGPGGFVVLKDPARYRQVLYDALQAQEAEDAE
jgi:hypothetical protein